MSGATGQGSTPAAYQEAAPWSLAGRWLDLIDDDANEKECYYYGAHEDANNHYHDLKCGRAPEPGEPAAGA